MRVRKAKVPPKKSTRPKRRPGRVLELSPQSAIALMEQDRIVVSMILRGCTLTEIARALDINDLSTVSKIHMRAFEAYRGDHTKLMARKFTEGVARLERIFTKFLPLALGEKIDDKGEVIGQMDPDAEAARVVIRAQAQISRMCGHGQQYQIQHTGDGGGPILTANLHATTQLEAGPEEAARLVREAFGGKVQPYTGPVLLPPAEKVG